MRGHPHAPSEEGYYTVRHGRVIYPYTLGGIQEAFSSGKLSLLRGSFPVAETLGESIRLHNGDIVEAIAIKWQGKIDSVTASVALSRQVLKHPIHGSCDSVMVKSCLLNISRFKKNCASISSPYSGQLSTQPRKKDPIVVELGDRFLPGVVHTSIRECSRSGKKSGREHQRSYGF
jgi:hypothetical protein